MVDRITKALRKLSAKEQKALRQLLAQVRHGDIQQLDVKKLKGRSDIYRIRKGSLRIIYHRSKNGKITVLALERRNDTAYS